MIIFDNRYHIKTLCFFSLLLSLTGCSVSPVTWDERIKKRTVKPVKLAYEEQGSGQVILLLHGFAESRFTWRYLAGGLASEYRVISLDLKGFGESPKPKDGHYSIYDQAIAVQAFIEEHDLKKVTLMGHSFGGGVALTLALMAEESGSSWQVDRLILLAPAAYKQNLPSMLHNLNRPVVGRLGAYLIPAYYQAIKGYEFAFYDKSKIPAVGVHRSAKDFSRQGSRYVFLHTARQLIPDDISKISQKYATIKPSTLLIWGDKDRIIPSRYGQRLQKDLPNSHLEIVPNVGHMTQEEAPEKILSLVKKFMK